jgi:DNA-binding LacI/PurR family transcriptional regulator
MGNKLEDVAKLAGVHPSTVSRAISKPEKVKPETRRKIESIINELGYKPDYFARGLMNGRTDSVGIINVHLITIEAAVTGKRDHIYHAAMLDPHTAAELSIDDIKAMVDELIEAHGNWLPKYH